LFIDREIDTWCIRMTGGMGYRSLLCHDILKALWRLPSFNSINFTEWIISKGLFCRSKGAIAVERIKLIIK
jgi:hypothetical protein